MKIEMTQSVQKRTKDETREGDRTLRIYGAYQKAECSIERHFRRRKQTMHMGGREMLKEILLKDSPNL